jgi:hypothetical protein
MQVFISYSVAIDQLVALRLQTMAAVYGLTVYVPPATTRQTFDPDLSREVEDRLRESDVILAVMMHNPAASAVSEMNAALRYGKLLIPIVSPSVSAEYYAVFQPHFVLNLADPSQTEGEIVKFLAEKQQTNHSQAALVALTTLALGLILFSSNSK